MNGRDEVLITSKKQSSPKHEMLPIEHHLVNMEEEPPRIDIRTEWLASDPARSLETAVIAIVFVLGWVLAVWAYARFMS